MTKITYNNRVVDLILRGGEQDVRAAFVAEAKRQLQDGIREAGPDGYLQYVDGVKGAQLDAVKPKGGVILFEFYYTKQIAQRALEILNPTSPKDTGRYIESHSVFANNARVENLDAIDTARSVIITNTVPYARIIEKGMGKHVPWSRQEQVPAEGVYAAATKKLKREFGQIADIASTWVSFEGGTGRSPAIAITRR